jgi:hypothetical protein
MRALLRHVLPAIGLAAAVAVVSPGASASTTASWQPHRPPLPAGALTHHEYDSLSAVSCTSRHCVATGFYETAASDYAGLITERSGSGTTSVQAPLPGGETGTSLAVVGCARSGECVTAPFDTDYVDVLTGSTWTAEPISLPGGADDVELGGGAACSQADCVLAGIVEGGSDSGDVAVVEDDSGTWTAALVPVSVSAPTTYGLGVSAISCRLNGNCEAVGEYSFSPGPGPEDVVSLPVIITGSVAGGWSGAAAHLPAGAMRYRYEHSYPEDTLASVSCPHSGQCVAVGHYDVGDYVKNALILHDGAAVQGPVPQDGSYQFDAQGPQRVSCATDTACTIAGSYTDAAQTTQLFVMTGAGSTWTVAAAPLPLPADAASNPQAGVTDLSCGATSFCGIVGSYGNASDQGESVLLNGAGSSWTATSPPPPVNNATVSMSAVSCTSSACTAAGDYENSSGTTAPLLETLAS